MEAIRRVKRRPDAHAARVLGAHMEAPFLAISKAGAQRKEFFCEPDLAVFRAMAGEDDTVRLITLAP